MTRITLERTANHEPLFLRCIFVSLFFNTFSSPAKQQRLLQTIVTATTTTITKQIANQPFFLFLEFWFLHFVSFLVYTDFFFIVTFFVVTGHEIICCLFLKKKKKQTKTIQTMTKMWRGYHNIFNQLKTSP